MLLHVLIPGGCHLQTNVYQGVPPRALKSYPFKHPKWRKLGLIEIPKLQKWRKSGHIYLYAFTNVSTEATRQMFFRHILVCVSPYHTNRLSQVVTHWKYKLVDHLDKINTHWHTRIKLGLVGISKMLKKTPFPAACPLHSFVRSPSTPPSGTDGHNVASEHTS